MVYSIQLNRQEENAHDSSERHRDKERVRAVAGVLCVTFAWEVLTFLGKHYTRDADGKLRLDPAMTLETCWGAVNPGPDLAGLQFCLDELLAMQAGFG